MKGKLSTANLKNLCQYVINPLQLGGIETYVQADGPGVGNRVAWVNTGGGLGYKVVIDRGLDIADAFYKGMSLAWLSLGGVPGPNMAMNRQLGWLWGFGGGLLVSCGPSSAGAPCQDQGQELPLHGWHSNLRATLESVINPDPLKGRTEMSISGLVRQARIFDPNLELHRTISSQLGQSSICICDKFINRGNTTQEHAWLMHMNLGYPLIQAGSELIFKGKFCPLEGDEKYFSGRDYRIVPKPLEKHRGAGQAVAYIDPKADRGGMVTCGVINQRLGLALKLQFSKKQFPRIANWHHFGPGGQFVMGVEPANCGVEGRDVDRQRGWLDFIEPGQKKNYQLTITVMDDPAEIKAFRKACS